MHCIQGQLGVPQLVGAIVLALWSVGPPAPVQLEAQDPKEVAEGTAPRSREEIEAGLDKVRRLLHEGHWGQAEELARSLMSAYAGETYALEYSTELVDELKTAQFGGQYQEPKPKDLVHGQLRQFSKSVGTMNLFCEGKQLADFDSEVDYVDQGRSPQRLYFFPAVFTGAYRVLWKARTYPDVIGSNAFPPVLLIRPAPAQTYVVMLGHARREVGRNVKSMSATVRLWEGNEMSEVAKLDSPGECGASYTVELAVDPAGFKVKFNGKELFEVPRDERELGSFGFFGFDDLESLEIKGKVERSWMQRLQDDDEQEQWKLFDAAFDSKKELPREFQLDRCAAFDDGVGWVMEEFSSEELDGFDLAKALAQLDPPSMDEVDHALEQLKELGDQGKPGGPVTFLECMLNLSFGKIDAAREHATAWQAAAPGSRAARATSAYLAYCDGDLERARELFGALAQERPDDRAAVAWQSRTLFRAGAYQELDAVFAQEALNKRLTAELMQIHDMLEMARRGPTWVESFQQPSDHYLVRSDIDKRTCYEVAEHLESSLRRFGAVLGDPPAKTGRSEVFVFSGRGGYDRYTHRILGTKLENTAGVYCADLRQLLIWNVPDRTQLFATVRHEGLHQYLSQSVKAAPIWLNEGLAEYFENAQFQLGPSREIVKRADHIATLTAKDAELVPLEEFLEMDPQQFYRDPEEHYAQAWALVYFLLKSGKKEEKACFDVLLKALRSGKSEEEATHMAFDPIGVERLEKRFRDFLLTL